MVSALLTQASGTAERDAAIDQLGDLRHRKEWITVGGDKAFDTRDFVAAARQIDVTPHVAQNTTNRSSAIDAERLGTRDTESASASVSGSRRCSAG